MSQAYIDAEMKLFEEQAKDVDIIITTALIPGKPAPKLITEKTVGLMKPGSVVVDLAAQTCGNCELCKPNEITVTNNHLTIIGYTDLPSRLPSQSSRLYATNVINLLKLLTPERNGQININFDDLVVRGVTILKDGEITWPAPPIKVSATTTKDVKKESKNIENLEKSNENKKNSRYFFYISISFAPKEFLGHFNVFILSCVIGYYVVWNVIHSLHTPLMSVTNAISGIVIVGAILQLDSNILIVKLLAFIAVLIININIFGGFFVTKRMLRMFKK
ncbi:Re/Si-specific NAD(P)(+) transhydrogenase subunit alpha [Francisella sp. SYW-9]|uniref:Re/Si-specific NAD(P)(+) transhydrogenase subunit alpha n=1 Tax=Francisella sp. SYW-9 TaxID=2610888 RepID=UPI00398C94C9